MVESIIELFLGPILYDLVSHHTVNNFDMWPLSNVQSSVSFSHPGLSVSKEVNETPGLLFGCTIIYPKKSWDTLLDGP